MTIREMLQIEIWSKETSRRIIRRTWKIAKPVAVVLATLVLLLGTAFVVEWNWLTGGERRAGEAALAKIEALERLERNAGEGFETLNREAKSSTAAAEQKAWTIRDRQAAGLLEIYRWELETDHEARLRGMQVEATLAARHITPTRPGLEMRMSESKDRVYSSMRALLHKELD